MTRSPNSALQRSGGRCVLECGSRTIMDRLPMIRVGEPPAAELGR